MTSAVKYLEWNAIESHIDHKGVRQFGELVMRQYNELKNNVLLFTLNGQNLNYNHHEMRLKEFLIEEARKRAPNSKDTQANLLGLKNRATLYLWEKKVEEWRKNATATS